MVPRRDCSGKVRFVITCSDAFSLSFEMERETFLVLHRASSQCLKTHFHLGINADSEDSLAAPRTLSQHRLSRKGKGTHVQSAIFLLKKIHSQAKLSNVCSQYHVQMIQLSTKNF